MRVLVLWADPVNNDNLGVRVLAEGMARLALEAWGPDTDVEFQDYGPGASGVSFGKSAVVQEVLAGRGPIRERLRGFDAILDTGAGDSFTDAYGLKRLFQMHVVHRAARKLGIPIVMGPQTIGPFRSAPGRAMARRSLGYMSAVTVRDPQSARATLELGRKVDAIATDVVWILPVPERSGRRSVVVNVSGLLWSSNSHVAAESYRTNMVEIVERLVKDGRHVTILAHVVGVDAPLGDPASRDNDVPAITAIRQALGENENVDYFCRASLEEVRALLAGAEVVIAARLHACLNALSVGTPAVALAYSRKFDPLLREVGWDQVIDLRRNPEFADQVIAAITDAPGVDELAQNARMVREEARPLLDTAAATMRTAV